MQISFERKLEGGHEFNVNCIESTHHSSTASTSFLSGSEGGELSQWAASDGTLIKKCRISQDEDIFCLQCSQKNHDIFYASSANRILAFDIRNLNQPTLQAEIGDDIINQIVLNADETFLASGDDSGNIKIYDLEKKKIYKTLKKHTSICSSLSFHPLHKNHLISCGYDNKIIQWDIQKSRAFCVLDTEELGGLNVDEMEAEMQVVVSPPFAHSLSLNNNGSLMCCGTENALIHVFKGSHRSVRPSHVIRWHTKGVSQVHFLKFYNDMMVSTGNDHKMCLWRIRSSHQDDYSHTNGCSPTRVIRNSRNAFSHRPLQEIVAEESFNWLASTSVDGANYLLVAENANRSSIYRISQ